MKRMTIAGLLVTGCVALSTVTATPAQAEDCYTIPELPGECLDQATHDYIVDVQAERDFALQQVASLRDSLGLATVRADYYQNLSQQLATQLQASRLETNLAKSDLESAYAEIDRRGVRIARLQHRVMVQRATIKYLRDRLRDLP